MQETWLKVAPFNTRSWLKLLIKTLVSCALIALILISVPFHHVFKVIRHADLGLLLAALVVQFLSTTLSAYRWQLMMQNLGFGQSFSFYWCSYFKGSFFNQGLPTSIGGDVLRVLDMASLGFRKRDAFYGVLVDRGIGLAALISLSLSVCFFSSHLLPAKVYYLVILTTVLLLFGSALLIYLWHRYDFKHNSRLFAVSLLLDTLRKAVAKKRFLLTGSSLLIPILAIVGFFITGWALGLRYSLDVYFLIVPLSILLTVVPVSLAGWGVREGTLIALFSIIGADHTTVLAMSALYGVMLIAVSLPGLFIYLTDDVVATDHTHSLVTP